jgi:hypothetical protein
MTEQTTSKSDAYWCCWGELEKMIDSQDPDKTLEDYLIVMQKLKAICSPPIEDRTFEQACVGPVECTIKSLTNEAEGRRTFVNIDESQELVHCVPCLTSEEMARVRSLKHLRQMFEKKVFPRVSCEEFYNESDLRFLPCVQKMAYAAQKKCIEQGSSGNYVCVAASDDFDRQFTLLADEHAICGFSR